VDDNQINLKVALAYLARHNIRADRAFNGIEAIEMVKQKKYDLIFMDHMMPGMDGVEAAGQIRAIEEKKGGEGKPVPIIALSANAVTGARETFIQAGMNDFLPKPIDPRVLNRMLIRWLPENRVAGLVSGEEAAASIEAAVSTKTDASELLSEDSGGAINQAAGAKNASGDRKLYFQLLKTFLKEHAGDMEKIREGIKKGDRVLARRVAHTLKSTAAMIGAEKLRAAASSLEQIFSGGGKEPAAEDMANLESSLEEVLNELRAFEFSGPEKETAGAGGDMPREEERILLIEKLLPLVETGNTESFNYFDTIRESFPSEKGEAFIEELESFEFEKAREILLSLKEEIKNGEGK
jgi:CheY-like chemotaxis protein